MPHKLIPTDSLSIQEGYNVIRSDKELAANVADVVKHMEQSGDNPVMFPIRYVKSGANKFTRNHATLLAAKSRNWPQVYAIELPYEADSITDIVDLVLSNNGGHAVSRVKQGELYLTLQNGQLKPGLENGKIVEDGDWIRKPMDDKEIAASMSPVYTAEHIRQCKILAQSTPEIRALIESEEVAANIVVTAKAWSDGDPAKQLRILKAAIRVAKEEGKTTATKKHIDAVKSEFVKLTASSNKCEESTPSGDNKPAKGANPSSEGDSKESSSETSTGNDSSTPELQELFTQAESELLKEGSKKNGKMKGAWATILLDPENVEGITLDGDTVDTLVEKLHAAMVAAHDVF
jgi:hypothetical protein